MSANFILLGKHPQSHPSPTVFLCTYIRESPISLLLFIVDLKSFLIYQRVLILIEHSHTTLVTRSFTAIWKATNKLGSNVLFVTAKTLGIVIMPFALESSFHFRCHVWTSYQRHTLLANHLCTFRIKRRCFLWWRLQIHIPYLLDLCRRVTIIFWSKIKDKTLQIVPHCGIIRGCATILF